MTEMKLISVFVTTKTIKEKRMIGINWRGLILRGLDQATKTDEEGIRTVTEKIGKMATKVQEQSVRIYKLEEENKEVLT